MISLKKLHLLTHLLWSFLTLLLVQGFISLLKPVAAAFESPHHSEDVPILDRFSADVTPSLCSTEAK